jgi:hypothetical protein
VLDKPRKAIADPLNEPSASSDGDESERHGFHAGHMPLIHNPLSPKERTLSALNEDAGKIAATLSKCAGCISSPPRFI